MDVYIDIQITEEDARCTYPHCDSAAKYNFRSDDARYDGQFCNFHAITSHRIARRTGHDCWYQPIGEDESVEDYLVEGRFI